MTEEEYKQQMNALAKLCRDIAQFDTSEVSRVLARTHAIGPMLDPTAYRDGMGRLEDQATVVRAIHAAQRELQSNQPLYALLQVAPAEIRT